MMIHHIFISTEYLLIKLFDNSYYAPFLSHSGSHVVFAITKNKGGEVDVF